MKSIMKLHIKIVLVAMVVFAGCSDVLDEQPRSILTPDFFETGAGIRAGLTAAYSHFRYYYASEPGFYLTVCGTDEYHHGQQINNHPFSVYTSIDASRGEMSSAWDRAYP
ncbi:MAG: hypothetical protein AAGA85_25620, partial [Bacteroidota bacterium]